ncbi:MAG TPA: helix-turn-helix transcriptional regulator [Bdellovibrio sp.]|uniref:helix-turn-helix domain-containing protein n=1 Tax=Bdellovibrio sp. TaxID=28201 RepID=UPI002EF9A9C0
MGLAKGTALISSTDKKILKALGERIREIREKKKLTVYDVTGEDLLIKSRQHWQKIEAGQLSLTFVTFYKIAQSLEIPPVELLKGL